MQDSYLYKSTLVPRPLDEVFPFFADASNLQALTPPWVAFKILTPLPLTMAEGALIDYRLRIRGLPIRWTSEITAWEPPYRFVDEQRRGPYRLWVHEHRFESLGNRTRVIDKVRYRVLGGKLIDRWLVRPDLERIFDYRGRRLMNLLAPWASVGESGGDTLEPVV